MDDHSRQTTGTPGFKPFTNSIFEDYSHTDDHTRQTTDTPGFKPFTNDYECQNTKNGGWKMKHSSSFSSKFEVFGFVIKHKCEFDHDIKTPRTEVEKWSTAKFFFTENWRSLNLWSKHKCEWLMWPLKQIRASGENEGKIWLIYTIGLITVSNPSHLVIFLCLSFINYWWNFEKFKERKRTCISSNGLPTIITFGTSHYG